MLTSADHRGSQVANRRLSTRRTHPVADALAPGGLPPAPIAAPTLGQNDPQIASLHGVPDPLRRYARIIFPVPPPLR